MKKIILIDGNNFMFRSFYATSYTGNIMRNSEGFPTNALFGFTNMLYKIIEEEKPDYMCVAFDIGKNFRKDKYSFYKDGRSATPEELKMQMPIARDILDGMGIKYLELEPYEADDIIGTLVKMASLDNDFDCTIISSDKDLLQLINFETDVKLLKKDSHIRYDEKTFFDDYGIEPIKIIDLKSLMGDTSDNIPGVKGVGEKTALKLLQEYKSLEGVYENIENIKGSLKDKLVFGKEDAFMSKEIATIYLDVPLNIDLNDLIYKGHNDLLVPLFKKLGFNSFINKIGNSGSKNDISYKEVSDVRDLILDNEVSLYIELDNENYHKGNVIGIGISDSKNNYYINSDLLYGVKDILKDKKVITYDIKKHYKYIDIMYDGDLMISSFLIGNVVKDDISFLMNDTNYSFSNLKKTKFDSDIIKKSVIEKSSYIYKNYQDSLSKIHDEGLYKLYSEIELPLTYTLYEMEISGTVCKRTILEELKVGIKKSILKVTDDIYEKAGEEFNISSPKQLGDILFTKLNIADGKKNKTGFKTDASVLEKLKDKHPIIDDILLYRNLTKIYSTYIEGLENYIDDDSFIHPIYKQTLARTGRLSCTEPNLQNIPVKEELGRKIRKAFVPFNDIFVSADYSQIELRILAHVTGDARLVEAFNNDLDIHASVASDIFKKDISDVTKLERKTAKAVIFGIVYGISGFGLSENLKITRKEADDYINKYLDTYSGVKSYMDKIVSDTKVSGEVRTIYNRKRIIDEIKSSNYLVRQMGERMALNTPIQGTSADIIKVAMIRLNKYLKDNNFKSKLILQVHDELILDCVYKEVEDIKKALRDIMENVIKLSVPLKVEVSTGTDWFSV